MKILHVSDLHFYRPWFAWVADHAGEYDAIAVSGDLLHLYHETPLDAQIEWVSGWLCQLATPVVVCSGNHDFAYQRRCEWLSKLTASREQLHGDREMLRQGKWTMEAVPYGGLPVRGGENHIVVAHVPPAGAPTAISVSDELDWGDRALARCLKLSPDTPWLILSGHIHDPNGWQARWRRTWSLNPLSATHAHAEIPNRVVLDLEEGSAAWHVGDGEVSRVRVRRNA